jgi:hypothetical protein
VWGGINGLLFHQMLHGVDIQLPSSRFFENVTSTSAERSAARKLPAAAADSPPELARLQLQAAELAATCTILMVPLCKDGRLLGDDAQVAQFPDLLARSSEILRDLLGKALDDPPVWARPLGFSDYFGIRHRRFRHQLTDMLADPDERVTINRRAGEITISLGGDTNQAAQFARSVPDFVLKGRFTDLVKLDLQALEQEMGFDVKTTRPWWRRLIRR